MKHERATEEVREIAALYALGSLTQHEARSFEVHTQEECPVCEAELRKFQRIVAGIGLAAEEAAAPEYMRDLLLARVERAKQSSAEREAPDKVVETRPQPKKTPPPPSARLFQSQQQEPKSRFTAFFLAAIATALCMTAVFAWRSAREAERQLQVKLSAAQADAENLRIMLDVQQGRTGELEQILSMAGKPGTRVARLAGHGAIPSPSGAVFWDTSQGLCLAIGIFPPEPEGKIYQVWFISPTQKSPAGSLKIDPTGRTFTIVPIPRGITGVTEFAVTVEPDNGSGIPTLPYYATARFE